MHVAANFSDLELIKYLLASGADIHAKDVYGANAAFFVVNNQYGQMVRTNQVTLEEKSQVIKYLASRGLNLNDKTSVSGDTVLTSLVYNCYGSEECKTLVNLLLDLGVDVNQTNKYGENALMLSVDRINIGIRNDFVKLLITRGANVNQRNTDNKSALDYALKDQQTYKDDALFSKHIAETVQFLKDAGATLVK